MFASRYIIPLPTPTNLHTESRSPGPNISDSFSALPRRRRRQLVHEAATCWCYEQNLPLRMPWIDGSQPVLWAKPPLWVPLSSLQGRTSRSDVLHPRHPSVGQLCSIPGCTTKMEAGALFSAQVVSTRHRRRQHTSPFSIRRTQSESKGPETYDQVQPTLPQINMETHIAPF